MAVKERLESLYAELPPEIALVAVSKFHPSSAIREARAAGQLDFAESRPQELSAKAAELADLKDLRWHFIGHLQTNKLKMVLPYAHLVQSVDSERLLDAIQDWAAANSRTVSVLLEYHVAAEDSKQGFDECGLELVLEKAAEGCYPGICFRGLMAMATNTDEETVVAEDFERARRLFLRLSTMAGEDFDLLSMGMSGDWRIAVEAGSNMVRIGSYIFGERI
ncbi:MAG: YggS family pyridoxal phosphate-dependent enzyme [Bacteroidales bacterium]|nr:YggS family pyridoxal phosphate-dependent enzyme [Bacteroidales bacterium]